MAELRDLRIHCNKSYLAIKRWPFGISQVSGHVRFDLQMFNMKS